MVTEWVDVADNAVKIGLGSMLTILGGYLTLKLSQRHELRKEALIQRRKDFDAKAGRYIEFLSSSRMMLQKYMVFPFRPDGEDYIEYTKLHETVSLMSTNQIMRKLAFDTYIAVSQACLMATANRDEKAPVRLAAEDAVSQFQANANDELRREKAAIERINKKSSFLKLWQR
ncbi:MULTISPECIES: hypothetical protein [Enterobacter]|uniref:hypothetical protein n=1 Tax=Enterobacter TaxID=547 RepID=UPI001CC199B3|nr:MULTISPECIES: hypothetical protein [Enterobacter]UAN18687.1 hypothetical protein KGP20_24725 [Enterobacter asburiae]UAN34102.1 hypothetical protein KGP22_22915 [Enterobacter sp. JBIWA005]